MFFLAVEHSAVFFNIYIYKFSNFITVLGIFKVHPRSRLLCLSQSHYHLNQDFITTGSGISRPIIHLDAIGVINAVWPVFFCSDELFYPY